MKVYTKIYWSNLVCALAAVATAVLVTTLVILVQTHSFSVIFDQWMSSQSRKVGSMFYQSELSFPDDLQPQRPAPRQTARENGGVHIMIRHPKGIDLDPKPVEDIGTGAHNQNQGPLARRPPQCILLGFAKCGTSALLEFLDLHPNIVTLDWEPDYFCDRMYPKYDLQWYVRRMPPSFPGQVTIEKSPCYIVEHSSHLRMHAMNTSLKVMVLVRDPLVRLLSEYAHYSATERYWGRIPTPFLDRITVKSTGKLNEAQLLKTGNYLPHFEHLLQVFPREQVLVLDGDALISDPLSQTKLVENFLGLAHVISGEHIYHDDARGFYCMRMPDSGQRKCLGLSKGRQHENIDGPLKKRLAEFYLPYNTKLFKLLGQRFEWPK